MGDLQDPESWAKFTAMQRSHQWKTERGNPQTKRCAACGDTNDSPIRYCTGVGALETRTVRAEARIEVPPLEAVPGQETLFPYKPGGMLT